MNKKLPASLRETAVGGVFGAASATAVQIITQLAGLAILARVLTPSDFGIAAPSIAIATLLAVIAEFGLGANLIQRPKITAEDVGTAISFSLLNASVLSITVLLLLESVSGLIALAQPGVLILCLSIVFLVPVSSILESVNLKRFRFRRVQVAVVFGSFLGNLIVPVGMALSGCGLWSLVAAQVLFPLVKIIVLSGYMKPQRLLCGSAHSAREMLRFSGYFTLSKLLSMISLQGDRVVLADAVGPAVLGLYTRAQNIPQIIINFLTSGFERALFPVLASIQHDPQKTKRAYMEVFFLVSAFTGLAAVVAATTSYSMIVILLGERWGDAAEIAAIFSAMIFLRCTDRLAAILLRSNSMLKERVVLQSFLALGTLGSCYLFGRQSMTAVAWAIVGCNTVGFIYTQLVVVRFLKAHFKEFMLAFSRSAIIAGVYVIVYSVQSLSHLSFTLQARQLLHASLALLVTLGVIFVWRKRLLSPMTREIVGGSIARIRRR